MITELDKAKDLMDDEQYELAINILNKLEDLPSCRTNAFVWHFY